MDRKFLDCGVLIFNVFNSRSEELEFVILRLKNTDNNREIIGDKIEDTCIIETSDAHVGISVNMGHIGYFFKRFNIDEKYKEQINYILSKCHFDEHCDFCRFKINCIKTEKRNNKKSCYIEYLKEIRVDINILERLKLKPTQFYIQVELKGKIYNVTTLSEIMNFIDINHTTTIKLF
jgi:hypothetical protein